MKKSYIFFRSLLLIIFFLGYHQIGFAQDNGDDTGVVKVGEEIFQKFDSPHPYLSSLKNNETKVWSQHVKYEEATYISLHFSRLDLATDDFLLIKSSDGERSWRYYNKGNQNKLNKDEGFWSVPIYGNEVIIEIHSVNSQKGFGYAIDKFARGFTEDEMNSMARCDDPSDPDCWDNEAICGDDDSREAKCYQTSEPEVYDHSRAVARLLINGTNACTGWLIGDEGHLMTNNHCVESMSDANNVTVEFMAEGSSCATNCQSWFGCSGTIEASSTTLVKTDSNLDYSLLQLPTNVSGTYGFLQLRESGASVGERIYIPQHPRAWGKRISLESDHSSDSADGFAHVFSDDEPRCGGNGNDIGYFADTQGGSSGSPVIGYDDHLVVALHHCANCPNRGVPIKEIIDDLGNDIPNNSLGCSSNDSVVFHFEDEDGNKKDEFCLGEDVYVDGSETIETQSYYMDLWIQETNGDLDWISGAGWTQGSPDFVNIKELFENDPENPVVFEAGITYALKLAINDPDCGWVELIHTFTFFQPNSVVYHYEDKNGTPKSEFCIGEDVYLNGSETLNTSSYFMDLWVVDENGEYDWISNAGWMQGSPDLVNITALFANDPENPVNFEPGTTYSVKLAINDPDCGWVAVQHHFTYVCCDDFWDASFFPSTNPGSGSTYNIQATGYETYGNHAVIHEWYLLQTDADGNYVPVTSSVGGFSYSGANYDVTYTLVHKLRTPCGEICFARTVEIGKNSQKAIIPESRDLFDCDILDELFPCDLKTGKIRFNCDDSSVSWLPSINIDGYALRIYYNQGECCDTPLTEPSITKYFSYTQNSYTIPNADNVDCLTIQLGVLCDGDVIWGDPKCKTCCRIDGTPENLDYDCETYQATFSPVEGAYEYIVEITYNDRDCFCIQGDSITHTRSIGSSTSFLILPMDERNNCFSFRVGAKCEGLSEVFWSEKQCVDCSDDPPRPPKGIEGNDDKETLNLFVSPNPASSIVELKVRTDKEINGFYTIYSLKGFLVERIDRSNGSSMIDISNYPSGLYFVQFISDTGLKSEVKKLIVKH